MFSISTVVYPFCPASLWVPRFAVQDTSFLAPLLPDSSLSGSAVNQQRDTALQYDLESNKTGLSEDHWKWWTDSNLEFDDVGLTSYHGETMAYDGPLPITWTREVTVDSPPPIRRSSPELAK